MTTRQAQPRTLDAERDGEEGHPGPRPDIASAANLMSQKLGAGRELKKLDEYLTPHEGVQLLAKGNYGGGIGLLALTDKRLLFVKHGVMKQVIEDFPIENISSIKFSAGLLTGKLVIFASGNHAEILDVPKPDGKAIADRLRYTLSQTTRHPDPQGQSNSVDLRTGVADELAKLAQLRDAGVLTIAEFEAQKARLLI